MPAKTAPSGCSTSAIVGLTDGTTLVNVTISAAAYDSGAITQNYAYSSGFMPLFLCAASGDAFRSQSFCYTGARWTATNHLPHSYEALLHRIAAKRGILLSFPPNIRFIDFEDPSSGKGTDLQQRVSAADFPTAKLASCVATPSTANSCATR